MDNFNSIEIDLVVRGLFALQKLQPSESATIQQLINKMANTVYQVEEKDWVGLTGTEINHIFAANAEYPERMIQAAEALLKEKNNAND